MEALQRRPARSSSTSPFPRSSRRSRGSCASWTSRRSSSGHSAGGAFTQILLDHGFGAAGVALNSAPTEGVRVVPLSQVKSTFPVLKSPANRHKAVGAGLRGVEVRLHQHVHRGRGPRAVRALPHPGQRRDPVGQRAGQLPARPPGHLGRLPQRQPGAAAVRLRLRGPHHAAGDPAVQHASTTSPNTVTEIREYEGYAHLLPAQKGWEQIADDVLDWAAGSTRDVRSSPTSAVRPR